jgi:Tol biopolymer transport system component
MTMNKLWWRGLIIAGVIAPLVLWLVLAPIPPTRGLEKGQAATGEHSFSSFVGVNRRVSVASDGTQGNKGSYHPSISSDGRYVAFVSDADNLVSDDTNNFCDTDYNYVFDDNCPEVFVHDRQTGETERVSVANDGTQANYESYQPSISADGRFVAFSSGASNLVEGDTNGYPDVFVRWRNGSR